MQLGKEKFRILITLDRPSPILKNSINKLLKIGTVGNKGNWLLYKVSCLNIRQVAITYRRGTSVVKNLKFLTPFFNSQKLSFSTITVTYLSSYYW